MFGLLRPKPPLGPWEKAWVETQMHGLAQKFVDHRLLDSDVILPNEDYFPGDFEGTDEDVQRYLDLVSRYMRAEAVDLQIAVCEDCRCDPSQSPAETPDGRSVLQIPVSRLSDPQLLVATLSHAVSRELLRRGHLSNELVAAPWLADLLTEFLGLGIFGANSLELEAASKEYLPTRMRGYALSLFAWIRDERHPGWRKYLRPDGAARLHSGLRYLDRTGDSLFRHSTLHLQRSAMSVNELIAELRGKSESVRIAALWSLAVVGPGGLAASEAVTDCLRAKDSSVRAEAAATLAAFESASDDTCRALVECLRDSKTEVRASVVRTLGVVAAGSPDVMPELAAALGDDSREVVAAAAIAVGQQGAAGSAALADVLAAFRAALVRCDDRNAGLLAATLQTIVPDAEDQVRAMFDEYDSELRQVALEILAEQSSPKPV